MSPRTAELLREISLLPREERDQLRAELDQLDEISGADGPLDPSWATEIDERVASLQAGAELATWEEVRAALEKSLDE